MADYISRETAIYKKAFEIAVRCARELNGTPELKEAYVEAQKNNMALLKFTDFCLEKATEELSEQPSAEAEPVRHGLWMPVYESEMTGWNPAFAGRDPIGGYICSACKEEAVYDCNDKFVLSNYCPYCGAKMDGGSSNETN